MQKTISSEKYAALITWLKQARVDQHLSMRELAGRMEAPHSFVQKVEMLERRLDVFEYVQYCHALGIKPELGLKKLR